MVLIVQSQPKDSEQLSPCLRLAASGIWVRLPPSCVAAFQATEDPQHPGSAPSGSVQFASLCASLFREHRQGDGSSWVEVNSPAQVTQLVNPSDLTSSGLKEARQNWLHRTP